MLFICFNHQLNQNPTPGFFPSRLVFEREGEYASNLSGALSSELPPPESPPPAVAAPAAAPAPAAPATERETQEIEAPRERRRLRSAVDAELERRLNEFQPQIEKLLENPTPALREFVRSHSIFEVGKTKATEWNLEFYRDVLGKTEANPRDAQCAAYALQHVLNDLMQKNHKGTEYPFRQERDINTHTRLDGYIGGYTVSVLAGYLNFHQPDEGSEAELLNYAYLEGGKTDHRERYAEAMGYLDGIFGENAAAAARAPERVEEAYNSILNAYERWLISQNFILLDTQSFPQFQRIFGKVVDYLVTRREEGREDFDQIFNEMNLDSEEIAMLWPQPGSQKLESASLRPEEPETDNLETTYPFKSINFSRVAKELEELYASSLYRNLQNLEEGHEVDYGVTIVQDFLEQPQWSGPSVRAAYKAYREAIKDYSKGSLEEEQAEALMNRIQQELLPELRKALDAQKQDVIERIKYWEAPGRLPPDFTVFNLAHSRQTLINQLPMYLLNGPTGQPTQIYTILADPKRDRAFADYQALRRGIKEEPLSTLEKNLQTNGFLGTARTPEQRSTSQSKVLNLFNNALWIRNIDRFMAEQSRHFLPREGK